MTIIRHQGHSIIFFTFCIAYMLVMLPIPVWAAPWRPAWVGMVLIYWCLAVPLRVGVTTGWVVGLFQDVLAGTLIGQQALGYALIAYFAVSLHRQVRLFPLLQQSLFVGVAIMLGQLPSIWINGMLHKGGDEWGFYIYPVFTSILLWHWVYIVLRHLRRTYHVD